MPVLHVPSKYVRPRLAVRGRKDVVARLVMRQILLRTRRQVAPRATVVFVTLKHCCLGRVAVRLQKRMAATEASQAVKVDRGVCDGNPPIDKQWLVKNDPKNGDVDFFPFRIIRTFLHQVRFYFQVHVMLGARVHDRRGR